ncbi:MAG: hypothetical protein JJE29_08445 [Peptostreptococcaceae bacterium]|nr:hypothetical protein [Peptostreptococcaceae bacterium]
MFLQNWKEEKFEKIFNNVYYNFNNLRESDESFSREDLRKQLDDLYVNQGNDLEGRGESMDIAMCAQIAALEQVLSEWEDDAE